MLAIGNLSLELKALICLVVIALMFIMLQGTCYHIQSRLSLFHLGMDTII